MGDYELDPMFVHHKVDIDKWSNLSKDTKVSREKKFLSDKGKANPNLITSTDGLRSILKTPNAGRKPNQRKRKRADKTRTPSAKRVLLA